MKVLVKLGRQHLLPQEHGLEARHVRDLQREDGADADLIISVDGGVYVALLEGKDGEQVLDGGDAAAKAFCGAEQGSRPDLLVAALGVGGRQRHKAPDIQRNRLEGPLQ